MFKLIPLGNVDVLNVTGDEKWFEVHYGLMLCQEVFMSYNSFI